MRRHSEKDLIIAHKRSGEGWEKRKPHDEASEGRADPLPRRRVREKCRHCPELWSLCLVIASLVDRLLTYCWKNFPQLLLFSLARGKRSSQNKRPSGSFQLLPVFWLLTTTLKWPLHWRCGFQTYRIKHAFFCGIENPGYYFPPPELALPFMQGHFQIKMTLSWHVWPHLLLYEQLLHVVHDFRPISYELNRDEWSLDLIPISHLAGLGG